MHTFHNTQDHIFRKFCAISRNTCLLQGSESYKSYKSLMVFVLKNLAVTAFQIYKYFDVGSQIDKYSCRLNMHNIYFSSMVFYVCMCSTVITTIWRRLQEYRSQQSKLYMR